MVWVETPTNPLLKLADLTAIGEICRQRGIVAAADNTFASPWNQRPLEHGFDVVVHSTTKYLNGHSDVIGGVAVVSSDERVAALREQIGFLQNSVGAIAGPRQLRCAESRRSHCAWSATARTRSRSRSGWRSSPRSNACATRVWLRTRSTNSHGARCAALAAW
jgi:O-acetylhomoserine/O-acetylserine sulfhydrylase-like pyridoxal-dependent enzyme